MKFTYLLVFTLFTQIISAASSNSPASPVTAIAHTGSDTDDFYGALKKRGPNAVLAALTGTTSPTDKSIILTESKCSSCHHNKVVRPAGCTCTNPPFCVTCFTRRQIAHTVISCEHCHQSCKLPVRCYPRDVPPVTPLDEECSNFLPSPSPEYQNTTSYCTLFLVPDKGPQLCYSLNCPPFNRVFPNGEIVSSNGFFYFTSAPDRYNEIYDIYVNLNGSEHQLLLTHLDVKILRRLVRLVQLNGQEALRAYLLHYNEDPALALVIQGLLEIAQRGLAPNLSDNPDDFLELSALSPDDLRRTLTEGAKASAEYVDIKIKKNGGRWLVK